MIADGGRELRNHVSRAVRPLSRCRMRRRTDRPIFGFLIADLRLKSDLRFQRLQPNRESQVRDQTLERLFLVFLVARTRGGAWPRAGAGPLGGDLAQAGEVLRL